MKLTIDGSRIIRHEIKNTEYVVRIESGLNNEIFQKLKNGPKITHLQITEETLMKSKLIKLLTRDVETLLIIPDGIQEVLKLRLENFPSVKTIFIEKNHLRSSYIYFDIGTEDPRDHPLKGAYLSDAQVKVYSTKNHLVKFQNPSCFSAYSLTLESFAFLGDFQMIKIWKDCDLESDKLSFPNIKRISIPDGSYYCSKLFPNLIECQFRHDFLEDHFRTQIIGNHIYLKNCQGENRYVYTIDEFLEGGAFFRRLKNTKILWISFDYDQRIHDYLAEYINQFKFDREIQIIFYLCFSPYIDLLSPPENISIVYNGLRSGGVKHGEKTGGSVFICAKKEKKYRQTNYDGLSCNVYMTQSFYFSGSNGIDNAVVFYDDLETSLTDIPESFLVESRDGSIIYSKNLDVDMEVLMKVSSNWLNSDINEKSKIHEDTFKRDKIKKLIIDNCTVQNFDKIVHLISNDCEINFRDSVINFNSSIDLFLGEGSRININNTKTKCNNFINLEITGNLDYSWIEIVDSNIIGKVNFESISERSHCVITTP